MLVKVLAYIWMAFGLYWVILEPARLRDNRGGAGRWLLRVLILSFVILFWKRRELPALALILLVAAWTAVALYWAAPATRASGSDQGESGLYRTLRLALLLASFVLLFWNGAAQGWLSRRFLPPREVLAYIGFVLTLGGLLVALWARLHLGRYWSDRVRLTADHQLIRTGPYAYLRHPIYSGVLLAVAGTSLAVGEWRAVLAFALLLTSYSIKARREERVLAELFGKAFEDYHRRTGFLVPPLGTRRR